MRSLRNIREPLALLAVKVCVLTISAIMLAYVISRSTTPSLHITVNKAREIDWKRYDVQSKPLPPIQPSRLNSVTEEIQDKRRFQVKVRKILVLNNYCECPSKGYMNQNTYDSDLLTIQQEI